MWSRGFVVWSPVCIDGLCQESFKPLLISTACHSVQLGKFNAPTLLAFHQGIAAQISDTFYPVVFAE
jgi:hypothetical protein